MTKRDIRDLLRRPLVVAPMGAGPTTAELVLAAAGAGAVGFLAGAYKTAAAMTAEIDEVIARTSEPFGVNLFVPGVPSEDADSIARYLDSIRNEAEAVGAELGDVTWDDDGFDDKVTALLERPPPLVSFTFGCPNAEVVAAFRDAGSVIAVTVTSAAEAAIAEMAGADALCVQGSEAGAHRGTFANDEDFDHPLELLSLMREVARATELPQLAAGGIMEPEHLQAALAAGAVAAQCGTAFLRCPESGAHPVHKAALVDPRFTTTAMTRAFSGRPARGLLNRFMQDHVDAPAAYPEINNATRPLRASAAATGDAERMSLWAGAGYAQARDDPASEIIERLCATG